MSDGRDAAATRVAWVDAQAGVAGDMLLGALVGLGVPTARFEEVAARLGLRGVRVAARPVRRGGIEGWAVTVSGEDGPSPERHLGEILARIEAAGLPAPVTARAARAFRLLADAEAAVHGSTPEHVHFHEVGAVDALVDVVGALTGLHDLGVERVVASPLPLTLGTVTFSHGTHALPAPATAALLEGVPVHGVARRGEAVTPTGAAILRAAADAFGPAPAMVVERHGRGAGQRDDPDIANLLRIFLGRALPAPADTWTEADAVLVEASVDDMSPQRFPLAMDALFRAGALDVTVTPLLMKKGRPGHLLSALCPVSAADAVSAALFTSTSSIGCRLIPVRKRSLPRETRTVETPFGPVPVKLARLAGRVVQVRAEFDDCARLAAAAGVDVAEVAAEAEAAARREG